MPGKKRPFRLSNYKKKTKFNKLVKKVNEISKSIELKRYDTGFEVSFANNEVMTSMNGIAQGLDVTDRIGSRITPTSLSVRGFIKWNDAATASDTARILIIRDKVSDGAVPINADLFSSSTFGTIAHRLPATMKRFQVLYDKSFNNMLPIIGGGTTPTKQRTQTISFKVPLKGKVMNFIGTSGATASLGQNMIYLVVTGNQTTASNLSPKLQVSTRLYYKDA